MKRRTLSGGAGAALILAALFAGLAGGCDFSGAGGRVSESESVAIMTWNLQALFDGTEEGNEYGEYRESAGWSNEKYAGRLNGIAEAVGGMEPAPPDIIAVQEIESLRVLQDLAASLAKHGYRWSHFAGSPGMSLGLGLLSRFPLEGVRVHSASVNGGAPPRPVLEARVSTGTGGLALLVCHWKSKLGGADATEAVRRASARVILRRIRELAEQEPELPVIVMGDLNENYDEFYRRNGAVMCALVPDDPRAARLGGFGEPDARDPNGGAVSGELPADFLVLSAEKPPAARYFPSGTAALYSPWSEELSNGSYFYKDEWETIDHFLVSEQFFNGTGWEFEGCAAADFPPFVNSRGRPSAYNPGTGSGLSDHLPLLLFLKYRGN